MYVILDNDGFVIGMGATPDEAAAEPAEYAGGMARALADRAVRASPDLVARVERDGSVPARVERGLALPLGLDWSCPGAVAPCPNCDGSGIQLDLSAPRTMAVTCSSCSGSGAS